MIIKGKSRSGPMSLAAHLGNAEKNERVRLIETRGTIASDLRGALIEMDAYASGSKCEKPLYHAAISPEPPNRLTPQQRSEAIDTLEKRLGLEGHARVVVLHEKLGREHLHIVWSRIDLRQMKAVHDGHNYRKHEEVSRDLERRFGHERVQGAHAERVGVERPDRTPSRSELRQEERTGIKGRDVKAQVSAVFRASDGPEAFRAGLSELGYQLAKGDRRDYVIVDRAGGIHSLARRIDGINAAGLREFMSALDPASVPSIEQARENARIARHAEEEALLEKSLGRGGDYVSQSRAAQNEFERRQDLLNDRANRDSAWDRVEAGEARQANDKDGQSRRPGEFSSEPDWDEVQDTLDAAKDRQRSEDEERNYDAPSSDESAPHLGDAELTDAQQERLDRILAQHGPSRSTSRDGPGRQPGAPGGGRTRSR